ncbi:hypothetical protein QCE73_25665, partial [Caballeronia sp. LZ029]|nr:hypothetical protein [Caballeronia sp. LZ029]
MGALRVMPSRHQSNDNDEGCSRVKGQLKPLIAGVLLYAAAVATPAFAQSSVTLYGIVDDSIVYQSSQTNLNRSTP